MKPQKTLLAIIAGVYLLKTYRMAFEKDAALIRQAPQTSASRP